ncbi:MAG: glycogen debranching enzyme GlgX, partial [Pseudomonadota bacterium]
MIYQGTFSQELDPGTPSPLGAHVTEDGVNFAVFSENAEQVFLCLFSPDGKTQEAFLPLPERTGAVWHGAVPGLKPGALYGFRVAGPHAPQEGHRFNVNKLLI